MVTPESKPVVPQLTGVLWGVLTVKTRVLSFSLRNDFLTVYASNQSIWPHHMENKLRARP